MKNTFVAIVSIFIGLNAMANAKISGTITNPNGQWVYFTGVAKDENGRMQRVSLDSAQIIDGNFSLEIELDKLTMFMFQDGNELSSLWLAPGDDIVMSLNTLYFDETIQYSGKGSDKCNFVAQKAVIDEINSLNTASILASKTIEDSSYIKVYFEGLQAEQIKFIETSLPESLSSQKEDLMNEANSVAQQGYQSAMKELVFNALIESAVGDSLMSLVGVDMDGNEIALSSFYGKPVVVDFWATWCGPCKAEMPSLIELEKEYHDKVTVVSVGVWCKFDGWKEMASDYGFDNNIFIERGEQQNFFTEYMINFIPRYIVLDAEGNIVHLHADRPSTTLSSQLDEILK